MEYDEHEKRAWSVDFSRTDPSMLVSGGDDGKVCLLAFVSACYLLYCSVDVCTAFFA